MSFKRRKHYEINPHPRCCGDCSSKYSDPWVLECTCPRGHWQCIEHWKQENGRERLAGVMKRAQERHTPEMPPLATIGVDFTLQDVKPGMIVMRPNDYNLQYTVVRVNRTTITVKNPWHSAENSWSEETMKVNISELWYGVVGEVAEMKLHFLLPPKNDETIS